nr:transcription initiation factor TFIID subunit 4B isoform X2 [Pogona vitticeps]
MSTSPATAPAAAPKRVAPPGAPERGALAMGPPGKGAGELLAPLVPRRAESAAPPASRPVTPAGKPAAALHPAGTRVPLRLAPALCQQPRAGSSLSSSSVQTLVAKAAPAPPAHQLRRTSSAGPRLPSCQAVASKAPTTTIQLPANFQIPQGTVLIRSNTGQLMLVAQQALMQAQNQTPNNTGIRWSTPANSPAVKIQTPQNSETQVLKVLAAPVKTVSRTTHSITSTIKKAAVIQSVASTDSNSMIMTAKSLITGPSAKPPAFDSPALSVAPKPLPDTEAVIVGQSSSSVEVLENVKKCKNFLATLIKLASSGPQASEMGQNVKNLVQSLLVKVQLQEAKIEPEEFTKELYIELKSSPQPYLVPFLKKSLVALRQLMPNPQTFIQQCFHQSVPQTAASPSITAQSTASTVTDSIPVTATSFQSVRPVPRINPTETTSSQTSCPISCTSLVTRGSASLQLTQTTHALPVGTVSLQDTSPAASAPLAPTINTVNVVQPTSSSTTTAQTTGNASLQIVKPVTVPVMSSAALAALSSIKSVSSPVMATAVQTVKSALRTSATTSATVATISLPSGNSVAGKPIMIRVAHPTSVLSQSVQTPQAVKVKQLIVQKPSEKILRKMTSIQQVSACPSVDKSGSLVKQITLPGNKILSLQASPVQRKKIRENGTTSFRDEDDINDVTSMAGVNLSEENACILRTNSVTVGTIIRSCPEELLLSSDALQKKIIEIGKRHDITEVNSDVLNLISHATQERLRGLLEKLTVIAQHRMMAYKGSDKYTISSDTRAQLRFLEQLDHIEKQRKDEEEREMLLRAAKSRSNKEDPEQLRLKQKAKEMQQLEFAQMQQREANRAALAAIGPRRKRPLESLNFSPGLEGLNGLPSFARPCLRPRITRVCLRDLIFCMEQERELKHSLALYQALLK